MTTTLRPAAHRIDGVGQSDDSRAHHDEVGPYLGRPGGDGTSLTRRIREINTSALVVHTCLSPLRPYEITGFLQD